MSQDQNWQPPGQDPAAAPSGSDPQPQQPGWTPPTEDPQPQQGWNAPSEGPQQPAWGQQPAQGQPGWGQQPAGEQPAWQPSPSQPQPSPGQPWQPSPSQPQPSPGQSSPGQPAWGQPADAQPWQPSPSQPQPPAGQPGWGQQGDGQNQQPSWSQPSEAQNQQPGWAQQSAVQPPLQQPWGQQPGGPQTPPPGWAQQGAQGPAGWAAPQQQQWGPQPPGYQGQGQFGQPPKRNKGLLVAVGAAGVALLVLLAAVAYVSLKDDEPEKAAIVPPEQKSSAAATSLQSVPGLHYAGSFEAGGSTVQADLSVTRSGSASGTLTIDGDSVELMLVDGTSYINAPRSYWRKQSGIGEVSAPKYSDRWSKAPSSLAGFDLRAKLTPANLGTGLTAAQPLVPPTGAPTAEPIDGDQAIGFEGDDYQFYVSDSAPYHLLKIKGGSSQSVDLSVTELTVNQATDVFNALKDKVRTGLPGALDPDHHVNSEGKPGNDKKACDYKACTFVQKVKNSGSAPATVSIAFSVTKGDSTKAGAKVGAKIVDCNTAPQTIKPGSVATIKCKSTGGAWTKWTKTIKSDKDSWFTTTSVLAVQAVSSSQISALIGKLDQEQQGA